MQSQSWRVNRRQFLLGSGIAVAAGAGLSLPAFAADKSLRMSWWGPAERHRAYLSALALYSANTNIVVKATYGGFEGYFEKLQTQMAGGAAPDVFQIRGGPPPVEFIERGVVLDLTPYIGNRINTADLETSVFESVRYKGKVYEVPQGVGSTCLYVNKTVLEKFGGAMPDGTKWTWDDFATLANEIAKNAPDGVYGAADVWATGGRPAGFMVFVRQRGKELYTPEGKLGFAKEDLSDWLGFWETLRASGAVTPPDITAGAKSADGTNTLITGQAPMYVSWTGLLSGLQDLTQDDLWPALMPNGPAGSRPGQNLESDGPIAVYGKTQYPEDAVDLVNFIINSPDLDELLGTVNGVPISARRNKVLRELATGAAQKDFDYVRAVSAHSTPLGVVAPTGSAELETSVLQRVHEDVAFKRQSIKDGVDFFFSEADRLLGG
jgi:multiple sugar transport system substrate-binding protein